MMCKGFLVLSDVEDGLFGARMPIHLRHCTLVS